LVRSFKNVRRLIYYGILLLHFAGNFYTSTPVHVHAVVLSGRRIQKKYLPAFLSIKRSFGGCFFEKVFVYACGVNIHKDCQRLNLLRWKIFYEGVIKRNYRLWIFSKVAQRLEIKHLLISVICSKMVSAIHSRSYVSIGVGVVFVDGYFRTLVTVTVWSKCLHAYGKFNLLGYCLRT
jgi:hypothetical protein